MEVDNAYEALSEETSDHRWAFGAGFTDPLAGVDTSMPAGVDGADLAVYCLMLGDDGLIMSHRLQQWLTRAPELEEETALANIALDLLGQARLLLSRAGKADGSGRDEDSYAFLRTEDEFLNVRLVEAVDADFAALMVRVLVFSAWRLALLARLRDSRDPVLAAIAAKGVNEMTYHRDYSARWVISLGDGTDLSRARVAGGLAVVAPFVPELFQVTPAEDRLSGAGVGVDPIEVRAEFETVMDQVLAEAGLQWPDAGSATGVSGRGGREGVHTEAMGVVLAELQSMARAHPEAKW